MATRIIEASKRFPRPEGHTFQYGTAGFRANAKLLDSVVFRVALLAGLRSQKFHGKTVGIMITASHNPPEDNGVKLVDPMGEMLETSWEPHATKLANAVTDEELVVAYESIAQTLKINRAAPASAIFARDTRVSGPQLISALVAGFRAVDIEYTDFKIMTTPQLHYVTRCINTRGLSNDYGEPSEKGYYEKTALAFKDALGVRKIKGPLIADCANGVGGPKLAELIKLIPKAAQDGIDIKIINDDVIRPSLLNHQCGADFVKTYQRPPAGLPLKPHERCCSLDGDADRLIYYVLDDNQMFKLLDGDRIASLVALFIRDLVRTAGMTQELQVGVVQTAYANGASTSHITNALKLPVVCTSTGVKHLHHAATRFEIGVYFEANGHGTVVFSDLANKRLEKFEPRSPAQESAIRTLRALARLINQTVGDAISDLLLVEIILAYKGWTAYDWSLSYNDLPNRLVRLEVPDRNIFTTTDAERKLQTPAGLQDEINATVAKYNCGRSFARASGTEDVVRVYAEAATRGEADDLATAISKLILGATKPRPAYPWP